MMIERHYALEPPSASYLLLIVETAEGIFIDRNEKVASLQASMEVKK